MLLQTNSYIVPREKRAEHARLLRRFRQTMLRLGCDYFECFEQVGPNWSPGEATGRYVQLMRFRDRRHQQQVQAAERQDAAAQALIAEFCALINFPYQQQQGLFAVGHYSSVLPMAPSRAPRQDEANAAGYAAEPGAEPAPESATAAGAAAVDVPQPEEVTGLEPTVVEDVAAEVETTESGERADTDPADGEPLDAAPARRNGEWAAPEESAAEPTPAESYTQPAEAPGEQPTPENGEYYDHDDPNALELGGDVSDPAAVDLQDEDYQEAETPPQTPRGHGRLSR